MCNRELFFFKAEMDYVNKTIQGGLKNKKN